MDTTKETQAKGSEHEDQMWTIKHSATRVEIIAALQFAAQNVAFSTSDNLASCYQKQFTNSVIVTNVLCSVIRLETLLQPDDYQERLCTDHLILHYTMMKVTAPDEKRTYL